MFAHGSKLYYDDTEIVNLTQIGDLSLEADDIDVSDHDNRFREYVKGLIEAGEIPFEGHIKSVSNAQEIFDALKATDNKEVKVVIPTDPPYAFVVQGYVKTFGFGAPHDDKIPMTGAIKCSGEPTFGASEHSNDLSALVINEELMDNELTLIPVFDGETYEYVTTADDSSTYVKVTPTADDGVITVNGTEVDSGAQTDEVALGAAGSLTNVEIRVKEENKAAKIYNVTVAREAE